LLKSCSLADILENGRIYTEGEILFLLEPITDALVKLENITKIANRDVTNFTIFKHLINLLF